MPISSVDYASLIKDSMAQGLYENLFRMNDVLKLFPITEVGSLVVRGERWATLPTPGFRKLNDTYTESTGTTEPVEDRLAIVGSRFTEDDAYDQLKDPLYRDPVQLQFDMHLKSKERFLAQEIINGDISSTADGFDGLVTRLADTSKFAAAQSIQASSGNDTLKVLADAASARTFFDKFEEAAYQCGLHGVTEGGNAKGAAFMNKTTLLGIQQAARLAGYTMYTKDVLGYTWPAFLNIPFVDVGLQRDKSTEIISSAMTALDAGSDSTHIIFARFAQPDGHIESPGSDGISIVQAGGFRRLGPIETLTATEWGWEWIMGLASIGDEYCLSRLHNFTMAAS